MTVINKPTPIHLAYSLSENIDYDVYPYTHADLEVECNCAVVCFIC